MASANHENMYNFEEINSTNYLWKHFLKDKLRFKAKCKECGQTLSVKNNTTTPLNYHLRSKHPELLISAEFNVKNGQDKRKTIGEIVAELVCIDGLSFHAL